MNTQLVADFEYTRQRVLFTKSRSRGTNEPYNFFKIERHSRWYNRTAEKSMVIHKLQVEDTNNIQSR